MREIILDTETTGLNPSEGHKVIEIAAIEIIDFLPSGKIFHKYITPPNFFIINHYLINFIFLIILSLFNSIIIS